MIQEIAKLALKPKKYFPRTIKVLQQKLSLLFQNTSFFLQGQMDINPKSRWYNEEFAILTGGYFLKNEQKSRQICNLLPWDNTRRDMIVLLLRTIAEKKIQGHLAEVGVYKGLTAKLIHYYMPERKLYLFDTFEGFTARSVVAEKGHTNSAIIKSHFADTSLDRVRVYVSPKNDNILFYKGYFPECIPENLSQLKFAFVHLDADLYEPTMEGLNFFYPRMNKKGIIVIHDYNAWFGARKAVDDFFSDKNELPVPMPDKSGSVLITKQ
jgi:O-methyltransferase